MTKITQGERTKEEAVTCITWVELERKEEVSA